MSKATTCNVFCVACDKEVEAEMVGGIVIYPHLPKLYDKKFYQCPNCNNYVSCHADGKPKGTIPTPAVRKYRQELHEVIDPIWRKHRLSRAKVYKWMSLGMGKPYHTAEVNSEHDYLAAKAIAGTLLILLDRGSDIDKYMIAMEPKEEIPYEQHMGWL